MNKVETKNAVPIPNKHVHNLQKFLRVGSIISLVVLTAIITCGIVYYGKYKKNSPEYILRVLGKALVTGEEKYVSAVEEKLDTDTITNEVLDRLKFSCTETRHPVKPKNMGDTDIIEFTKDFLIVSEEIDLLLKQLTKAMAYRYEQEKIWPAEIKRIEYATRHFSGSPKQVVFATIRTQSGLTFRVSLTKENNIWTPYSIDGKENICQWLVQIEKSSHVNKITFEEASFLFAALAVQIGPEGLD